MENLKSLKALRIITIAVLIYAIFVSFGLFVLMVGVFLANPEEVKVVEDSAKQAVVFPVYFLLPIFITIIIYASRTLSKKTFNYKVIFGLAIFSLLYMSFGSYFYSFIQGFHS